MKITVTSIRLKAKDLFPNTDPKPKFKKRSLVWAVRVRMQDGGGVSAEIAKFRVTGYVPCGMHEGKPVYVYELTRGAVVRLARANRVFATEKEAARKVYTILSCYADQVQQLAHDYFRLS